ncbi:MAG: ABC-F family ATP-binding cassette domain-containing protein [Saprospiraceae bacterium]|nr:ABC-F family ATP-binding cassette domain-containing protein [Saprospiraceae bacterium]
MLILQNIYLQYGDRVLFNEINLTIVNKDKIGLVGRNGAGKSTILKIMSGELTPDKGNIVKPHTSSIGYLHQEMEIKAGKTVKEEALTAFDELKLIEQNLDKLHQEISDRTDYETESYHELLVEASDLQERFLIIGGQTMEADAMKILKGLGFKDSDMDRQTTEFSGGWRMRVELAKMLLQRPDYLLLDEPTNHLDIESIIWLEDFLKTYEGTVILISHDKQFLDAVTKKTIEIELGKTQEYKGNYSTYLVQKAERLEMLQSAFKNQQKSIAQKEKTITRFMAKASKTSMAQSMQKQLDKIDRIEIPDEDTSGMKIYFPAASRSGLVVVEAKNLTKSYDQLNVLDGIDLVIERGEKVAFVGQNGQGKSTLSKIIVDVEKATSGIMNLGHQVSIGYYAQQQADTLDSKKTLLETMENYSPPEMRTKLRAILGSFLFSGEDVDKKVSVLSGGERARLALACMLLRPFNLLVLDEPTNHLDIISKNILKQALLNYDGTMIVVSHDREFLNGLTEKVFEFRNQKIIEYLGDIQFFLEKRKLENMREVSLGKDVDAVNIGKQTDGSENNIDDKEKKKLQRQLQNIEKRIQELENELKKLEVELSSDDFYQRADSQTKLNTYNSKKHQLSEVMLEWENLVLLLS